MCVMCVCKRHCSFGFEMSWGMRHTSILKDFGSAKIPRAPKRPSKSTTIEPYAKISIEKKSHEKVEISKAKETDQGLCAKCLSFDHVNVGCGAILQKTMSFPIAFWLFWKLPPLACQAYLWWYHSSGASSSPHGSTATINFRQPWIASKRGMWVWASFMPTCLIQKSLRDTAKGLCHLFMFCRTTGATYYFFFSFFFYNYYSYFWQPWETGWESLEIAKKQRGFPLP